MHPTNEVSIKDSNVLLKFYFQRKLASIYYKAYYSTPINTHRTFQKKSVTTHPRSTTSSYPTTAHTKLCGLTLTGSCELPLVAPLIGHNLQQ